MGDVFETGEVAAGAGDVLGTGGEVAAGAGEVLGARGEVATGAGDVVGTGDAGTGASDVLEACGEVPRQPRTHTQHTRTAMDRMSRSCNELHRDARTRRHVR
jgi:hypothetical protein